MTNYYFLALALPEVRLGDPLEISFEELNHLLEDNLTEADKKKVRALRRYFDLNNIRSLWRHEDLEMHGNFNAVELEEALISRQGFPPYVYSFLDKYDHLEDRLNHFPELTSQFFEQEIGETSNFLKHYLMFERDMRLILVAFRARKLGRDLLKELQFENPDDPIVAQILAQKDSDTYEPPDAYEDLKPLFEMHYNDPLALHKALCEYRIDKIESMIGFDTFSSSRILGYVIEFVLAENWLMLDKQKGTEMMDNILKEAT